MIVNIVFVLIEVIKYLIVFSLILHGKFCSERRVYFGILTILISILLGCVIPKQPLLIILIFISIMFLYDGREQNKMIYFAIAFIGINYLDSIDYAITGYFISGNLERLFIHYNIIERLLGGLGSVIILLLIAIVNKNNQKYYLKSKVLYSQCMLFLGAMTGFFVVITTLLLYQVYGEPNHRYKLYILLATATLLTISCILAFFLYSNHLKKENDLKTKNIEVQEENDGLRLALYANMEMMDDDMRQYRHDNRHHRAVLSELASKGDLEEIKDYLAQLSEQDEDLKKKNVLYTGNYMVDAIINGIIAKEAYSDVKFHCEGKLPRKLMIQDVDLSELLSNGLENAAEACLHSNGDKCVLFKAASYENMIHCEIKNTYDSTRYKALSKGDFETTKKNSEYHGYGIESMRCVVKKYDGKLEYIVEPEWVITDIYLQQKDEI